MSAMLTGDCVGVGHDGSRGAAYVQGWIAALDHDPREIYKAAADAQHISDYLMRPIRDREQETAQEHRALAEKYSAARSPRISSAPTVRPLDPPTGGGVAKRERGVWHTTRPFFAVPVRVFRPRPDDTSRASGEGRDGSDPPFLTAGAVSRWGGVAPGVAHPPPPGWGRSRPYVSLREGSPARARAGRSATPRGPMRDALLRAFLVIGGISAACAWT